MEGNYFSYFISKERKIHYYIVVCVFVNSILYICIRNLFIYRKFVQAADIVY